MRKIRNIIVHCTATLPTATPESILRYWHQDLGWRNPGYHYLYTPLGDEIELLDEKHIANGARGYNASGIHLSYIGGIRIVDGDHIPVDNRTFLQKRAMYHRIIDLMKRFPEAKLIGHNEVSNKACPCFNVREWIHSHQLSLTT